MHKATMRLAIVVGAAHFALAPAPTAAEGAGFDDEIVVVAPTPGGGSGIDPDRLPFTVQAADADALERAQALGLTDYLNANIGSVNINSAQNNPLQSDLQYRGYTASPLLGLPQGVAVYQNGVRINEPLGDAVNWDLVPESAVHSMSLLGGANPLFGLNTLGGALVIEMKNGFNFSGHRAEALAGSWDRVATSAESGGNDGRFGYYVNASYFEEDGWRDLSASDALNVFGTVSFRGTATDLDLSAQYGDSKLTGNGPVPVGLLAIDRAAIFTAPDITENDMRMFTLAARHEFSRLIKTDVTGFYRDNETDALNGDGSEFVACALGGGTFLLEGLEDDDLHAIGLDGDDVCHATPPFAADADALEAALNALAAPGDEAFNIDDLSDELSGTGIITDEAISNTSTREQEAYGADLQFTFLNDLFARGNYLVLGFSYYKGAANFNAVTELSRLNPVNRSTAGLGVGTFVDEVATDVSTVRATWSAFFFDSFALTERLTLTFGGRYNDTSVELDDRSGERPELNGDHGFSRFNPSIGATFDVTASNNVFAGYSESSRAPTPIELACNDGVFEIARGAAIARGEDPDDVNFECRLPNAFLADPPLDQVVAKGVEVGVRGQIGRIRHRLGYFRTINQDDIIFQSTGRSTGLFANIDESKREGFESAFAAAIGGFDWSIAYSYIRATFEDDFRILSPNHQFADDNGEIGVSAGDRIPGIPEHQFKFGIDHSLPWNLRIGAELLYNSGQILRGDESNRLAEIGGYALVNLKASCRLNEHFEIFARVTNLFDKDYENFGLLGEDAGEILPGLADQSPRFVGPGAPRGGWVGVRFSL